MRSIHYVKWVYHGVNSLNDVWGIRHVNDHKVLPPYDVWAARSCPNAVMFAGEQLHARDGTRTFEIDVHTRCLQYAYMGYVEIPRNLGVCAHVCV